MTRKQLLEKLWAHEELAQVACTNEGFPLSDERWESWQEFALATPKIDGEPIHGDETVRVRLISDDRAGNLDCPDYCDPTGWYHIVIATGDMEW